MSEQLPTSATRLKAAIDELCGAYVGAGPLSCIQALVAIDEEVLIDHVCGDATEDGRSLAPNAIFRIASMTKPVTVVAALMLVERGLMAFDTPLSSIFPEFAGTAVWTGGIADDGALSTLPLTNPLTIYDLLRHTAGLSYSFYRATPIDRSYAEMQLDSFQLRRSADDYAATLAQLPLLFNPGERFHYSVATDLLGAVIEKVSGEPLDRVMTEYIFEPLRMDDTGFLISPEKTGRLVDAWMLDEHGAPKLYDRGEQSRWRIEQKFYSGGGGLLSTARDYHRFLRMLLNGGELEGVRILSESSVAQMMRNHLPSGTDLVGEKAAAISETSPQGVGMGLGAAVLVNPDVAVAPGSPGTYFWGGMLSTGFFLDPSRRMIGIIMTQLMPSGATALREDFRRSVYGALAPFHDKEPHDA